MQYLEMFVYLGQAHARLHSNDDAWQGLTVIFSDANVPGEGEHKIIAHMRTQRTQPGYPAGLHHVIYGMDADLILLGLASHEARVSILREASDSRSAHAAAVAAVAAVGAVGVVGAEGAAAAGVVDTPASRGPATLQYLHVHTLREYLVLDFLPAPSASAVAAARPTGIVSIEHVIDDLILLFCLVGNDFLPALPSLEIREGALDEIMWVYVTCALSSWPLFALLICP